MNCVIYPHVVPKPKDSFIFRTQILFEWNPRDPFH